MSDTARERIDALTDAFEDACRSGSQPSVTAYLAKATQADQPALLRELVRLELEYNLRAGQAVRVEQCLARYPELAADRQTVLDLIVLECRVRLACAEPVTLAEYLERFPTYREEVAGKLSALGGPLAAVPGYELLEELGRGGMGVVYRAVDVEFGRLVAIKLVRSARADHAEAVQRFLEEARITGRLQHPGVPPVHRLGTLPDGQPFLAMKLIQGRTFADLLSERAHATADLPRALQVFELVCQTVAYAHEQGVVHRDLKPSNIMVGAFGEVQVMDWGLAKLLGAVASASQETSADGSPVATQAGVVLGTPAYMPPEQARGEHQRVEARSDVFALGALLCEILTGQPPYAGMMDALASAQSAQLEVAWQRLDACAADAELVALARRCLAPEPAERPADAAAVAQTVAAYRLGVEQRLRAVERERAAAQAKAAEERKRRRVQRWLSAAVLLLLGIGGAFAWYADRQAAERRGELSERTASARTAITVALEQAKKSLQADKPEEARIALAEAQRRLQQDLDADLQEELTERLGDLQSQLALLLELNRIHDRRWTLSDGKFDKDSARRNYPQVFQQFGLKVFQPSTVQETLRDWAIREQVLGALDLWLSIDPKQTGLLKSLAALDPDADRNAWRTAVTTLPRAQLQQEARRLEGAEQPPRFLAAYANLLPYDRGVRLLRSAWDRHPNSFPLAFVLANSLYDGNASQKEEAAGFWRVCLGLRPECSASLTNLGVALGDKKDHDGAIACFRKAVAIDAKHAKAYYNLGNALSKTGAMDEAIQCFRKAIALDPRDARAQHILGLVLVRTKGDLVQAIDCLHRAIDVDPNMTVAHVTLGMVQLTKQETDQAIASFRKAIALDPKRADVRDLLGMALQDKGDWKGAMDSYRQALRNNPKLVGAYDSLASLLLQEGEVAKAIQCRRDALVHLPNDARAHYNLGVLLMRTKKGDEAIQCFRQATKINPKYANAYCNLGVLLEEKADHANALDCYRMAIRSDPQHARAHCNLGLAQLTQGHFAEAVEHLQRGHDLGSKQPGWQSHSAQWLRDARRLLDLDNRLTRVLEGTEKPASAQEYLVFADHCGRYRRHYADAVRLYAEAFRLEPKLAADLGKQHRHQAACDAVRAANGEGRNPPRAQDRSRLRKQALDWLRADLTAWQKVQTDSPLLFRQQLPQSLGNWLNDMGLTSVRDPDALTKLPEDERRDWQQLWDEVRRTVK